MIPTITIAAVIDGSPASNAGIVPGWQLARINGHEIRDVLDYNFYAAEKHVLLDLLSDGQTREISIVKGEYDDIGLEFETFLMDSPHSCANHCIFCFIDQLPCGMRESLYFKDDDMRLSFIHGNYVTLTNFSQRDVERIVEMHISPINISVHTTNPQLRIKMLGNNNAGKCLDIIKYWTKNDVKMNCQIVVCPDWNDADELENTLHDLIALSPAVTSISVVPVGLTACRRELPRLRPLTADDARAVLRICDRWGKLALSMYGTRIVFAADELYLKAEVPMPNSDYYEEFPQLENGVGMLALFEDEFMLAIKRLKSDRKRHVSLATGEAAAPSMQRLVLELQKHCPHVECHVYTVKNTYFGGGVTVAGLLTGTDILAALQNANLGDELLIPACTLKHGENVFLDDVTLLQLSAALNVQVFPVPNDGAKLADALLGVHRHENRS